MLRSLFTLLFTLSSFATVARFQPTLPCDIEALATEAQAGLANAASLEDVQAVQAQLNWAIAGCQGWAWSGDGKTNSIVIPLVSLPEGLYTLSVKTTGAMIVKPIHRAGDCTLPYAIVNILSGQADTSMEGLLEVKAACEFALEISNVGEPWQLSITVLQ